MSRFEGTHEHNCRKSFGWERGSLYFDKISFGNIDNIDPDRVKELDSSALTGPVTVTHSLPDPTVKCL